MALLNVRSILNKSFIINDLILDSNLDCLLLTETWLGTDAPVVLTEACPPDFNFLLSIRGGKRGGGTASVFKNTLITREVSFSSYLSFEFHAFVFSNPANLCVTVYRPPQPSLSFIIEFSEFLSIIHATYNRILITGDFNLHIDTISDSLSREFLNLLNCLDFKQHVTHLAVSDHYCVYFNFTSFNDQEAPGENGEETLHYFRSGCKFY